MGAHAGTAELASPLIPQSQARPGTFHQVSTRALAAGERIELWEDHNSQVLFDLGVRSLDSEPFDARERSLRLSQLTFAQVATSSHLLERTERHCSRSESDGVTLFFLFGGEAFFHHRSGTQIQRPGELLLCDMNQPFLRGFTGTLQEYVLTIPRAVFEEVTGGATLGAPLIKNFMNGENPHGADLVRLMRRSLNQASPLGAEEVEQRAVDLLATEEVEQRAVDLLAAVFTSDGANSPAARRREAVAWIRSHLDDSSLSVAGVAHAMGVSERTLTRAFSETGQGVARTILEIRLDRAHQLLTGQQTFTVQEVALSCGFVSAAHFSRVFRERYEATPLEVQLNRGSAAD